MLAAPNTFVTVRRSPDLERVLAIARRPPVDLDGVRAEALVELMTSRLRRPDRPNGAPCGCASLGRRCINKLLPAQAWALYEAPLAGGLLAPIGVGSGKTLLDILMPMVMSSRVAVLLVPPGLVRQLVAEYDAIREHFVVPSLILPDTVGNYGAGRLVAGSPALHVVPYSRFSLPTATDLLERIAPDLILADEAHKLKSRAAARTRRALRYFAAKPDTRLCAWSGTMTAKSLLDFAHLSAFALGEASPLPLDPDEVEAWAAVIDPSDWPAPPGALKALANPDESVISAVRRRITDTRGVISTRQAASCVAALPMFEREPPKMPAELARLIRDVELTWTRPDGEELVDALSISACLRQLSCGFYYRWRFPGKPPAEQIDAWFAARKAWGRELRERLKRGDAHMDSPMLCANAAERHEQGYVTGRDGDLPTWQSDAWPTWRDVKDTIAHVTEAVWVDDYLARDAAAWAHQHRGIVWYEHDAFGRKVAEVGALALHGGGIDAEAKIKAEKGDRSIVVSIKSHGTGRDGLQYIFDEQLVANPPSSGEAWEQLLGRLHRTGQAADEVTTYVYRHSPAMADAIDRAVMLAKYVEGILGAHQKLLACDVDWDLHP